MSDSMENVLSNLKSEDVKVKLNSISNLATVAANIGHEKTRTDLIPYINECLEDENEVTLAYAEQISKFIPLVGGFDHAFVLLPTLEILSENDEVNVRNKAVDILCHMAENMPIQHLNENFIPFIERLSSNDWFTLKSSACGLFASVYPRVEEEKKNILRNLFLNLCKDFTPMVRRSASQNFKKFVKHVESQFVIDQFLPVFLLLSQDHQDSVRLLCIENCIAISGQLTDELKEKHIKPVLITCSNDPAWRVRYMVANFYHNLVSVLGGVVTPEILKGYISLLKDIEPEVRSAATNSISGISALLSIESVLENILPCVQLLVTDESQFVRASLAKNIGGLSPILGSENTSNHLLELYLTLLRDDFSEVRLNLLSHLSNMTDIMRNNRISNTLLHALDQLISDNNWRTRLAAVEHLSVIASEMGIELFQQTNLANICFSLLGDKVFAIRNAGIENLISISNVFGISWAKENIIPKIKELAKHNNYIYRLTTLISISKLAHLFKGEDVVNLLIPILSDLSGDKVPNIRFNVCKTLDTICGILNGEIKNTNILPILIILQKDSDKDVRRFAESAIQRNFGNTN